MVDISLLTSSEDKEVVNMASLSALTAAFTRLAVALESKCFSLLF
jgi:hypothetical protein